MSAWQRWQASDFMKYCEGMLPPCLVCAELGKNLPCRPSPSLSMLSGGMAGLWMRFARSHAMARVHQTPQDTAAVSASNPRNAKARCDAVRPSQPRAASHDAATKSVPTKHIAMCAYSQDFKRLGVPMRIRIRPRIPPTPRNSQPRHAGEAREHEPREEQSESNSCDHVEEDERFVEKGWGRESVQIHRSEREKHQCAAKPKV